MASELQVDELKGVTADGNITITSEGGSATMQLQQGVIKSWASINGTSTPSVRDSFNVASLTDGGTGKMEPNTTNAFSSTDSMVVSGGSANGTGSGSQYLPSTWVSSTSKYWVGSVWGTTNYDVLYMMGQVTGDLA